eukprot:14912774-Alexandrium_andersonii.AAC.1
MESRGQPRRAPDSFAEPRKTPESLGLHRAVEGQSPRELSRAEDSPGAWRAPESFGELSTARRGGLQD